MNNQNKNLYEVEIPDPVKSNTPTWSNYLEKEWSIKKDALNKIYDELYKYHRDNEKLATFKKRMDNWNIVDWETLQDSLSFVFQDDKAVSRFLESLWYDGIHYYWGIDWESYVIFDDNKLEIKKHIKDGVEQRLSTTENTIPKTVSVWIKSKFSDRGRYKDVPVIRKIENETLYQWGQGEGRQFWTKDRKYAEQFSNGKSQKRVISMKLIMGIEWQIVHIEATKDPWKISKLIWNSLENNYNGVKPNRLDGENLSIKEAETLLTKSWKNLNKRIIGRNR